MATGAEIGYDRGATALEMANEIFGNGVTVTSASYTGPRNSSAISHRLRRPAGKKSRRPSTATNYSVTTAATR